jgi:hypothetical protein
MGIEPRRYLRSVDPMVNLFGSNFMDANFGTRAPAWRVFAVPVMSARAVAQPVETVETSMRSPFQRRIP